MGAEAVDDDRKRRNAIGPEAVRANESVFDLDDIRAFGFNLRQQRRRRPRPPHGNRALPAKTARTGPEPNAGRARPKQRRDGPAFPRCEADTGADAPVGIDERPPVTALGDGLGDTDRFARAGIAIGESVDDFGPEQPAQNRLVIARERGKAAGPDAVDGDSGDRRQKGQFVVTIAKHGGGAGKQVPGIAGTAHAARCAVAAGLRFAVVPHEDRRSGSELSNL